MNGVGWLIWKLSTIATYYPRGEDLGNYLKSLGFSWVSLKLANYTYRYNQIGGNDKFLLEYINGLKKFVMVGGWHWNSPETAGAQGDLAEERRQKLSLDHWLSDSEFPWKKNFGMVKAAKLYMSKLHGQGAVFRGGVGLCSYRRPDYHRLVPFGAFLNHENNAFNAPQVYWELSHNPAIQLQRSFDEYLKIGNEKFVPIGSAYGRGAWQPTLADFDEFVNWCKLNSVSSYGFYSLDWVLAKGKEDWINAVAPVDFPPPPPPPPIPPPIEGFQVGDVVRVAANGHNLWTHTAPNAYVSTRNGHLPHDTALMVDQVKDVSGRVWLRSGTSWFAGWLVVESVSS